MAQVHEDIEWFRNAAESPTFIALSPRFVRTADHLEQYLERIAELEAKVARLSPTSEPINHGALVRDADGNLWALCDESSLPWFRLNTMAWSGWNDIPAPITVLFDGLAD